MFYIVGSRAKAFRLHMVQFCTSLPLRLTYRQTWRKYEILYLWGWILCKFDFISISWTKSNFGDFEDFPPRIPSGLFCKMKWFISVQTQKIKYFRKQRYILPPQYLVQMFTPLDKTHQRPLQSNPARRRPWQRPIRAPKHLPTNRAKLCHRRWLPTLRNYPPP